MCHNIAFDYRVMCKDFLPLVMAFVFPWVQRRCVQQCKALIGREVARRLQHTVIDQCCTSIRSSSSPVPSCCELVNVGPDLHSSDLKPKEQAKPHKFHCYSRFLLTQLIDQLHVTQECNQQGDNCNDVITSGSLIRLKDRQKGA